MLVAVRGTASVSATTRLEDAKGGAGQFPPPTGRLAPHSDSSSLAQSAHSHDTDRHSQPTLRRVVHRQRALSVPRQHRTYLFGMALQPDTQSRYGAAVDAFIDWCSIHGERPVTSADFDEVLTDYIHELFELGVGKQRAVNTVYGVLNLMPTLRSCLFGSFLSLRAYNRLHPSTSYPPLSWRLACTIAVQMARHGWFSMAVGVLLSHDCLLRQSELRALRYCDIADASDARLNAERSGILVILGKTKTGRNQSVSIRDVDVQRLVRWLLRSQPHRDATDFVFKFTASEYRHRLRSVCRELSLSTSYVPHSLRHGGATRLYDSGAKIDDILLRGRWAKTKSAVRYIQSGPALLLSQQLPPAISSAAVSIASSLVAYFNGAIAENLCASRGGGGLPLA